MQNIKRIFSSIYVANYQPVTMLTYIIEFHFFKLSPFPYHLANLIFHIFNSCLVFWFVYLLCHNIFISFFVGIFFAIHPMHVESVAWIAERKDMLSGFFYILSIVLYLYYRENKKKTIYVFSVLSLVISLLSKPMAVTMPFILILLDYYKQGKISRQSIIKIIPYFIIAAIFVLITIATQKSYGAIKDIPSISVKYRILIPFYGVIFYLYKLFLPFNLSSIYPYPGMDKLLFPYIISPFIFILIMIFIFYSKKYTNKIIFGFLFFLIILLPVLQIIPVGHAVAADRYTYLSYIGIFYILGEGLYFLFAKKLIGKEYIRDISVAAIILVVLFFSYLTFSRCKVWTDSLTLWNDVISKFPNSSLAHNNLGNTYKDMGNFEKAIEYYTNAIKYEPDYAMAFYNRGTVYNDIGEIDKALDDLTNAIKFDPKLSQAYNNRGFNYMIKNDFDKAIEDFNASLKARAENAEALNNRATAYLRKGEIDRALKDYSDAIKINPEFAEIYLFRGNAYMQIGEAGIAISDYSKAIELKPVLLEARYNRAYANAQLGNYDKSWEDINFLKNTGFNIPEVFLRDLILKSGRSE